MNDKSIIRIIEALIFASEKAINIKEIRKKLPKVKNLEKLLATLKDSYKNKGINLNESNKSWYFQTAPDLNGFLKEYKVIKKKLSKASMETLSIISYFQPITKPEIDEIRGVSTHPGIFEILLNNNWIESKGRKEVPGRPMLWVTTNEFLVYFDLNSLKDLPNKKELLDSGLLTKGDNLKMKLES